MDIQKRPLSGRKKKQKTLSTWVRPNFLHFLRRRRLVRVCEFYFMLSGV